MITKLWKMTDNNFKVDFHRFYSYFTFDLYVFHVAVPYQSYNLLIEVIM